MLIQLLHVMIVPEIYILWKAEDGSVVDLESWIQDQPIIMVRLPSGKAARKPFGPGCYAGSATCCTISQDEEI